MLRNFHGYSQEEVAEKLGISRQAYAKWEKGETIPDVERCYKLAELYETTIDALMHFETKQDGMRTRVPPAPKGKYIYGTIIMNDRGQIVIPKAARDQFNLKSGERMVLLGSDNEGLALIKAEDYERILTDLMDRMHKSTE